MKKENKVIIVQGAQYGSEAKGAIAGYVCEKEGVDIAVRTGATNAGHTVYYRGAPYKMQQLPVGWVNPSTQLVLGAGSLIDPDILEREVAMVTAATGMDIRQRLVIDFRCGLHFHQHAERSKVSGRHHAIGATGKGCSEALIDKIRGRGEHAPTFIATEFAQGYTTADTAQMINKSFDQGARILLEGTQGTMLDLHLGPYPYTTHKSTGAAQWLMECGLSPALPLDILLVVRTFPIRVAGNSGPLPLETSWPHLTRSINQRRREAGLADRVGEWAIQSFEAAVRDQVATGDWLVPDGSDGLDMHDWSPNDRVRYAEAASELYRVALTTLAQSTVDELSRVFEFTTVTKKLRRVAMLHAGTLRMSGMLNRPHRVAVTFMNYEHPRLWNNPPPNVYDGGMRAYTERISRLCGGAPVTLTTFGPESHHVVVG